MFPPALPPPPQSDPWIFQRWCPPLLLAHRVVVSLPPPLSLSLSGCRSLVYHSSPGGGAEQELSAGRSGGTTGQHGLLRAQAKLPAKLEERRLLYISGGHKRGSKGFLLQGQSPGDDHQDSLLSLATPTGLASAQVLFLFWLTAALEQPRSSTRGTSEPKASLFR